MCNTWSLWVLTAKWRWKRTTGWPMGLVTEVRLLRQWIRHQEKNNSIEIRVLTLRLTQVTTPTAIASRKCLEFQLFNPTRNTSRLTAPTLQEKYTCCSRAGHILWKQKQKNSSFDQLGLELLKFFSSNRANCHFIDQTSLTDVFCVSVSSSWGFGLLDACTLTEFAKFWTGISEQFTCTMRYSGGVV